MEDYKSPEDKDTVRKLMKQPQTIIFFYWKDCGHCIRTMPHWKSVCKNKANHGLGDVKLVSVEREAIPEEAGVNGFPHFQLTNKRGKKSSVDGEKTSEDELAKFLRDGMKLGGRRRTRRRNTRRLVRRVRKTRH